MSNTDRTSDSGADGLMAATASGRGRLHAVRSGTDQAIRVNRASAARRGSVPAEEGPVRTCVGCRNRDMCSRLVRVVASPGLVMKRILLIPDDARRLPGRGAWLHPDRRCLDLAERRSSFTRALRLSGPVDLDSVRKYIESRDVGPNLV